MSQRKQTLDRFLAFERKRLEAFERDWRLGMQKKPSSFPEKLEEGQWDEALHGFDPAVSMVDAAPDEPGR